MRNTVLYYIAYGCRSVIHNCIILLQVFKYVSFNKTMTQLTSTIGKAKKDLAGFMVMFMIIFFAFAQLGYLLFGTQVRDFSDLINAM